MKHFAALATAVLLTTACGSTDSGPAAPSTATVVGDVLPFLSEVGGARVAGAKIAVLEHPERSVVTGPDGHFELDGLEIGTAVTLVMEHPDFQTTQTATVVLGEHGIHPFTIQAVSTSLFQALSALVPTKPDETKYCVIATTVTRSGGSLYVHLRQGEPGVSVTSSPAVPSASGPIYFNESALPDVKQPSTSKDGGAVFINVPPGEYTLSGTKSGLVFGEAKVKCRAGLVVNAGPPLGVLAHVVDAVPGSGVTYADDSYSDATAALCDRTAACVNQAHAGEYPAATEASCKAMFKDALSFVDTSCDESKAFRDAWRTLFDCRAQSCELALGDDTACAAEDQAFVTAMETYGACYATKHTR